MPRTISGLLLVLCAASLVFTAPTLAAVDQAAVTKAFVELPKYDWGSSREALNVIDDAIVKSYGSDAARGDLETRLLAVLGGKATRAAKQFCCRGLAMIGTPKSLPTLQPLLADKDLSHMARYALERIPGQAVSKALRDAAGTLTGPLQIGMINSLGARRDTESTPMLSGLLKNADAQVASAAAAALGRIGDKQAAAALMAYIQAAPKQTKSSAYDAALELATSMIKTDKPAATTIFDKLYAADRPLRVRCAALKGLAAVAPTETTPKILTALASDNSVFRGLAVTLIKDIPGDKATTQFAAQMTKLSPAGQVALLQALAARKDPAARSAVLAATASKDAKVATAAITALAAIGNAQDVPMLTAAATADGDKAAAARASLQRLMGKNVNTVMVGQLAKTAPTGQVQLIGALAGRNAAEAAPAVEKLAASDNADVSKAAIAALGTLGSEKQIPTLIKLVKASKTSSTTEAIDKALSAICTRVKAKAVDDLVASISGASPEAQAVLYSALARAGGDKALATIVTAAKAGNDGAVRALTGWSTPNAIAPLLDIASTSSSKVHKVLSLRGIIRLTRLRETPQAGALAALTKVFALADNAEKVQALAALGEIPTIESFNMIAPYVGEKALAEAAGSAAVRIASRVMGKDKALVRATLEKVLANVRSPRTKRLAERALGTKK